MPSTGFKDGQGDCLFDSRLPDTRTTDKCGYATVARIRGDPFGRIFFLAEASTQLDLTLDLFLKSVNYYVSTGVVDSALVVTIPSLLLVV